MKRLLTFLSLLALNAGAQTIDCRSLDLTGVPVVERPSSKNGDRLAIIITGDGGWRRIDAKIAERLRAEGVSVAGFLTPAYFRKLRTPDESACALERMIRHYTERWKRPRVTLIGYSRGADVLPFMASRLPADIRDSIDVIALLGLEHSIDFRYQPSWLPHHGKTTEVPVKPEVERLRGMNILCVYGTKEKNSLCPALDPTLVTVVREPGSHHFAGRYRDVAEAILRAIRNAS